MELHLSHSTVPNNIYDPLYYQSFIKSTSWCHSLPVQLARFFEMDLLNQGVGGYIFNARSLDEEISYQPDVVTVAYGIVCHSL